MARIFGWAIGYFVAFWLLGFSLAVPLTTLLYVKVDAGEKWPISMLLTAGAWVFFHGLFVYTLQMPFPEGLLLRW